MNTRIKFFFFIGIVLMLIAGCDHTTEPEPQGNLPILMDLSPAAAYDLVITQVSVTITRGDFTQTLDLTISGNNASGNFTDLDAGTYAIAVQVYDATALVATGQGIGEVIPGHTSTVNITLSFLGGGLVVNVDWSDMVPTNIREVLFVGNSHTYYNGGVEYHVNNLVHSAHPDWATNISAYTVGGATLENHFNDPAAHTAISSGHWDMVILQEQSSRPMEEPELFYQYAILLDSLIVQTGADTGFYMTWAWRNNPEMHIPMVNAYSYIGAYLDAMVSPCGISFYNAIAAADTINLYASDNYHPSMLGTYLAACTFYGAIWNESPVGNNYVPAGISRTCATFLQNIAWQTILQYNQDKKNLPAKPEKISGLLRLISGRD